MKTVGCKGSDANLYTLSNTLGNGNFSTNSFRTESDNIFTITNVFASCVVLTGSHLSMKSVWSPSTQLGKTGFCEQWKEFFLRICVLCAVKALSFPLPSSSAPCSGSQAPSCLLHPGLGKAGCPPASLCQAKHTRAGLPASLWLAQPSQAPSWRKL